MACVQGMNSVKKKERFPEIQYAMAIINPARPHNLARSKFGLCSASSKPSSWLEYSGLTEYVKYALACRKILSLVERPVLLTPNFVRLWCTLWAKSGFPMPDIQPC